MALSFDYGSTMVKSNEAKSIQIENDICHMLVVFSI